MIIVTATFRAQAGRRDELLALLADVQTASRGDDGCLHYAYAVAIDDPDAFSATEHWRDDAALKAHFATPHVGRLVAAAPALTDGLSVTAHTVSQSATLAP